MRDGWVVYFQVDSEVILEQCYNYDATYQAMSDIVVFTATGLLPNGKFA